MESRHGYFKWSAWIDLNSLFNWLFSVLWKLNLSYDFNNMFETPASVVILIFSDF